MDYDYNLPEPKYSSKKSKRPPKADTVTLQYHKLVVPLKMRSIYWKGFGFPANEKGEILTRQKIVCLFCQTSIAYNRNTSNLRMHLESKHHSKLMEIEANAPPRHPKGAQKVIIEKRPQFRISVPEYICTAEMAGSVQVEEESLHCIAGTSSNLVDQLMTENSSDMVEIIVPRYATKETEETYIDDDIVENAITEFLVTDLVSPDVVEGAGFKYLLSALRPGCLATNFNSLQGSRMLPRCHTALRDAILEDLSEIENFAVSVEEWTSAGGQIISSIAIHWIQDQDDVTLETRMLNSLQLPHGKNQWASALLKVLQMWGVNMSCIVAIVLASENPELFKELRNVGLKVVPCLSHSLQQAVGAALGKEPIASLLCKCRSLVNHISDLVITIPKQEDDSKLTLDHPGVWNSTYNMLETLVAKKQLIMDFYNSTEDSTYKIFEIEWDMIRLLLDLLEPFTVILETLSEEKTPSISLFRPFLCQMVNSHLKDIDTDSSLGLTLKSTLREKLSSLHIEESTDMFLRTSSILDPRFKSLPSDNDDDRNMVFENIRNNLDVMIKASEGEETTSVPCPSSSPCDKKPRLSGIGLLLGNLCTSKDSMSSVERAKLEVSQYQSEQPASFDVCPLQWWSATRSKCPNLAKLAKNYSSVPASTTPSNHISASKKVSFILRRASIDPEHIDKLIFLYANQKLFSFQGS